MDKKQIRKHEVEKKRKGNIVIGKTKDRVEKERREQ